MRIGENCAYFTHAHKRTSQQGGLQLYTGGEDGQAGTGTRGWFVSAIEMEGKSVTAAINEIYEDKARIVDDSIQ